MKQIKTKKLTITLATSSDLPALEEIENECDAYFRFDPPFAAEYNRSLRECLAIGDMIPGVSGENYKRENYHLYCIWKDNVLIGWISFYLGYQQKDVVYLSVLYIKEANRKSGLGAEILAALTQKWTAAGFRTIRLHCSLRNATGLRFWVKNGFDRIIDVECTGDLYPENVGGIELMKTIV